jgi:hypothetical protein
MRDIAPLKKMRNVTRAERNKRRKMTKKDEE